MARNSPDHALRLAFVKLNVPSMAPALAFWQAAMGFKIVDTYDEDTFLENILSLPGEDQLHLMLVEWKGPLAITMGTGHGPVGFVTHDVEASLSRAVAAGASVELPATEVAPGLVIAKFVSPQGHEAELVHQKPKED
ncbi:hypothetical protein GRI62_08770 [Erythrobacter arachoides]|uniref:VOC domain-containing protein n=1 Tax=Aurantiacibacter arachoides TaxID=1850444 RepID=A0A845A457_9SPHN|nr:VOC family protein [Aurantiacibacter arachoides]MXO93697.1 hypothetical protein [Aurantiacibacter arachoides]GGD47339.1 hypothetical protein GCM10011411_03850 [Aurantiacibacter arachoides]